MSMLSRTSHKCGNPLDCNSVLFQRKIQPRTRGLLYLYKTQFYFALSSTRTFFDTSLPIRDLCRITPTSSSRYTYRSCFIVSKILAKETSTIFIYLDSHIDSTSINLRNLSAYKQSVVHYEIHNSNHFLSRRETRARNKRQKIIPFRWKRLIGP